MLIWSRHESIDVCFVKSGSQRNPGNCTYNHSNRLVVVYTVEHAGRCASPIFNCASRYLTLSVQRVTHVIGSGDCASNRKMLQLG